MKFTLLSICLFLSLGLFSHDERYDSVRNLKLPEEVFSSERYRDLDSSTREGDVNDKISKYEEALSDYYSQFIEDKRIEEERQRAGEFTDKKRSFNVNLFFRTHSGKISPSSNINAIRLHAAGERSVFGPGYMIRDSETLFRTHFNLGKLYRQSGQKHKAMEHLLAGFRYRNFSPTEENFERENGLRELLNSDHRSKLQTHAQIRKELDEQRNKLKEEEDEIHLIEAENLRNSLSSRTTFSFDSSGHKQRITNQRENLSNKEKEYERSKEENYLPVVNARGEENANSLLELATLVRELETNEKSKTSLKQNYPIEETRYSNFPGYVSILEYAYRLSPENPEITKRIADEYKSIGKKKEALGFYLKYDNLPKERFSSENEKVNVSLSIAGLYSDLGQFVLAGPYYERHFQNLSADLKPKFAYFVGEFFGKKLGNLEKSFQYFRDFLDSNPENELSPDNIKKITISHLGVSKYFRGIRQPEKEEENLEKAYSKMLQLKDMLKLKNDELIQKKEEVLKLKKSLLYNTVDEELSFYREEEKKLSLEIEKLEEIKSLYHSLPKYELLIRLVQTAEQNNDYKKAKKHLREIMDFGTEVEVNNALRNIQRIESIEKDGFPRPWIP